MKRTTFVLAAALVAQGFFAGSTLARPKAVEVVIQNYTSGQVFSPPACVVHNGEFALYELGHEASAAVEQVAEDGATDELADLVAGDPNARALAVGSPILPGAAGSVSVEMDKTEFLSCIWMLVNTNDAFAAITIVPRPKKNEILRFEAQALDAGTEVNSEDCGHIPGPACEGAGGQFMGDDEGGVVLGHTGIQGTGDLVRAQYDWRADVAKVYVQRGN